MCFWRRSPEIGAKVERIDRHTVRINAGSIKEVSVDDEFIRKIRASYYFIGALLGKYKSAEVPLPGGCNIGSRPIDQHLKGFRALGAKVEIVKGSVVAHAIDLVGSHIYLDVVSVGADHQHHDGGGPGGGTDHSVRMWPRSPTWWMWPTF